jgi:hypothetical protein
VRCPIKPQKGKASYFQSCVSCSKVNLKTKYYLRFCHCYAPLCRMMYLLLPASALSVHGVDQLLGEGMYVYVCRCDVLCYRG